MATARKWLGFISPASGRDDAVPVGVGVVAGGDVVLVLAPDQRRHRGRRGAVHPDLAVPVERHEPPRRVDQRVHHGQVEPEPVGDLAPVGDARATERVGPDADAGLADLVDVEHGGEVVDVRPQEVVRRRRRSRPGERDPPHLGEPAGDQLVGALRDHARRVGVGRAAVGRVVLEAAVGRRVVRRRDHDAVGEAPTRTAGPCRGWRG